MMNITTRGDEILLLFELVNVDWAQIIKISCVLFLAQYCHEKYSYLFENKAVYEIILEQTGFVMRKQRSSDMMTEFCIDTTIFLFTFLVISRENQE
jgi:hypothetical protein